MKTQENTFRKGRAKSYSKISIETIVYEKYDDGFVLECEVETGNVLKKKTFSIDFFEWNNILGKIKDPFLSTRLQEVISEMAFNSKDWITTIVLPTVFGNQIEIEDYDFENQYMELRA